MCDLIHSSPRATSSHPRSRASYRLSFTLDQFPAVCRKKPNARGEPPPEAQAERSGAEAVGGRLQCDVSQSVAPLNA